MLTPRGPPAPSPPRPGAGVGGAGGPLLRPRPLACVCACVCLHTRVRLRGWVPMCMCVSGGVHRVNTVPARVKAWFSSSHPHPWLPSEGPRENTASSVASAGHHVPLGGRRAQSLTLHLGLPGGEAWPPLLEQGWGCLGVALLLPGPRGPCVGFGMGTASRARATPPCSVASLRWGRVLRGHQEPQPGPASADPALMSLVLTAARPAGPGVQPAAPWGPGLLLGRNLWLLRGCTHPDRPSSLAGALAPDPPSPMASPRPRPGWPSAFLLPPTGPHRPSGCWPRAAPQRKRPVLEEGCGSSRGLPSCLCPRGLRAQTCGPKAAPLPGRPGALLCLGPGGASFTGGRFARGGGAMGPCMLLSAPVLWAPGLSSGSWGLSRLLLPGGGTRDAPGPRAASGPQQGGPGPNRTKH